MSFGSWYVPLKTTGWGETKARLTILRAALMHGNIFGKVLANETHRPIPVRLAKGGQGDDETEPFTAGENIPLFSGVLYTRAIYPQNEDFPSTLGGSSFNVCFQLSFERFYLNPMRYVRHQVLPSSKDAKWGKAKWHTNNIPIATGGEFSLDGKDNWIPSTPSWDQFTTPSNWKRHVRRYIARISSLIYEQVHKAVNLVNSEEECFGDPVECEDYAIRELETAWEFEDSDPWERVRTIKQSLLDLGQKDVRISIHHASVNIMNYRGQETREFNSPGVRIALRSGFELSVYAKTNRRIRFEVVHTKIPRFKLLTSAGITFSKTSKPHQEMCVLLQQTRKEAADVLNTIVFPALAETPDLRKRQHSVLGFLSDLAKACEDRRSLRDVVSMLVTHGNIQKGVRGTPTPERLAAILLRLTSKRFNVLVRDPKSKGYIVAPRYRWALRRLRDTDMRLIDAWTQSPPRER